MFLANHQQITKYDLESIINIMSGAAPLGALDEAKLLKKAQREILVMQGFGLTETSPLVMCTRKEFKKDKNVVGSVGKPAVNTEVKIVDVTNPHKNVAPGECGELLVKGPQVMKGYHNRPKENEEAFLDGWLRTEDLMTYENGYFFVKDRIKELIKVKGFQVAPAELEELIRDIPNVLDAAVIGITHVSHGEVPRAYIVPKPGPKLDTEKINEVLKKKLAPYKQLVGGISVVESIPKNASEKILRRELKQQYMKKKH
ncbi:unnamed protein product [Brassicogethes aeneus]|uniref:Uncharacterized protein n=1 Tax=Brassicogethes aeneus TaxID=1431903 RepID=A0A9P0FMD6_BRAAE|nr:unnamed protein product [Brassicogethes aeneus]